MGSEERTTVKRLSEKALPSKRYCGRWRSWPLPTPPSSSRAKPAREKSAWRAVHQLSARRDQPFVTVNCAAIPAGLVESELFGHERGAFTGAIAQKLGRFELANQSTLFLDEIGDIPLELQPKLLRVLQEQAFERLGSPRTRRVDMRLVAATNRDLAQMVDAGHFRADLYYRLNVFPLAVPPLR
jgi:formate hydrogenlyase transcriptional activator